MAATDGVMALAVAPVSHKALVGTGVSGGVGGLAGSKAGVIETLVTMRLVYPEYLMVKARNASGFNRAALLSVYRHRVGIRSGHAHLNHDFSKLLVALRL